MLTNPIRIGLIGLRESGKSHLIALLGNTYASEYEDTSIVAADAETLSFYSKTNKILFENGEFLPSTQFHDTYFYSLTYKRIGNRLFGAFEHPLEILDVSGERFSETDKSAEIYSEWLAKCNAMIFLISGKLLKLILEKGIDKNTSEYRTTVNLFRTIKDHLVLTLREKHLGKIYIAVCVTQSDLFEDYLDLMANPKTFVKKHIPEVHNIVQSLEDAESFWSIVDWYSISSIGYVWSDDRESYVDKETFKLGAKSGRRLSQQNGKQLRDPLHLRSEGVDRLLEDIQQHIQSHPYKIPHLTRDDVTRALKLNEGQIQLGSRPNSFYSEPKSPPKPELGYLDKDPTLDN